MKSPVTLDRYPDDRWGRIVFTFKAARAINPTNDWMLARLVASNYIIGCAVIIILKLTD